MDIKGLFGECVKLMEDSARGPLLAASTVERIHNEWKSIRTSIDDPKMRSFRRACTATFGRGCGPAFFRKRALAVKILGGTSKRYFHHHAAVWASRAIATKDVEDFMTRVGEAYLRNGSNPLTKQQTERLSMAWGFISPPVKHVCRACAILSERVKELEALVKEFEALLGDKAVSERSK